jgi:hypothetical protein
LYENKLPKSKNQQEYVLSLALLVRMSSDMNCPAGHAADPLCYRPGDDDDAATGRRDVDTSGFPLDMIADYSTYVVRP